MGERKNNGKTGWREPNHAGVTYRDPKLYCFNSHKIIVVEKWPSLRCWRKTEDGQWRAYIPSGFGLTTLPRGFTRRQTRYHKPKVQQFWENLPKHIRTRLRKFPTLHFNFAWLFARGGEPAVELNISNPLLSRDVSFCRGSDLI